MPWERAGPGLEKFWFPVEKGNLQPQGKRAKPFLPPWTPLVVSVKADLLEPAFLLRSRTASQDNRGWAAGYGLWLTRFLPQLPGHCQQKQTHDTEVHHGLFCSQAAVATLASIRRFLLQRRVCKVPYYAKIHFAKRFLRKHVSVVSATTHLCGNVVLAMSEGINTSLKHNQGGELFSLKAENRGLSILPLEICGFFLE